MRRIEATLDRPEVDAFGAKLIDMLSHAGIALMTSIGHRTGLFDVLDRLEPAGSRRIAVEAGLSERYVREWLGAMVAGGVVEYDPADATYRFPAEHAARLDEPGGYDLITAFDAIHD